MSIYATDGTINVTVVDGTTRTGLYAADGSFNVVNATVSDGPVGLYNACGALNVTPRADHNTHWGRYAANGSMNVVEGQGSSGAQSVTIVTGAFAAFEPADLGAALAAWWSADDLADGAVSSWEDNIGGLTLAQATGANQPARAADSFNSLPGVTFATDDHIFVDATTGLPTGATAGETWAVWTPTSVAAAATLFSYGGVSGENARHLRMSGAQHPLVSATASGGVPSILDDASIIAGDFVIMGGRWSGTTQNGRYNGRDFLPSAGGTIASLNTGTSRVRIGATTANVAAGFFNGVLRHALITTTLTTSQRLQLEGWLAWDSNIQSILPTNHPYRYIQP